MSGFEFLEELWSGGSSRVQKARTAYNIVYNMLPTMSFLLDPNILAYIVGVNADREEANELVHPNLTVIRNGLEELNPILAYTDPPDRAQLIFQAVYDPMSACGALLTSATKRIATSVLGR